MTIKRLETGIQLIKEATVVQTELNAIRGEISKPIINLMIKRIDLRFEE